MQSIMTKAYRNAQVRTNKYPNISARLKRAWIVARGKYLAFYIYKKHLQCYWAAHVHILARR